MTPRDSHPGDELPSAVEQLLRVWQETEVELPTAPTRSQAPRSTRRLIAAGSAGDDGDVRRSAGAADGGASEQRWEQWTAQVLQRIHAPPPLVGDEEWPLLPPLPLAHGEPVWSTRLRPGASDEPGDELPDSATFQELARAALSAQPDTPAAPSSWPTASSVAKEPRSAPRLRPPPSVGAPARVSARVHAASPRSASVTHLPGPTGQRLDPQPLDPQPLQRLAPQPLDPQPLDPQPLDPQRLDPQPLGRQPTADASNSNVRHAGVVKWWSFAAVAAVALGAWLIPPSPAEYAAAPPGSARTASEPARPATAPETPRARQAEQPVEQPAVEQPAVEQPAVEQPVEQPDLEQPDLEQPGPNPLTSEAQQPRRAPASAPSNATERPVARLAPRPLAAKRRAAPEPLGAQVTGQRPGSNSPSASAGRAPAAVAAPTTPPLVPAAREGADSSARPTRPTIGAAQNAIGAVLGAARACVAGQSGPSRSTVVFASTGAVREVHISGAAAGTSAEPCLKRALGQARVRPFSDPSFSVRTTVRP